MAPRNALHGPTTHRRCWGRAALLGQCNRSGSAALRWLLVLLVLGFLGYYYLMGRVDHKLTGEILSRLRKELPYHVVTLDRASLQPGKSILLEGIRISKPTDQGLRELFRCSRLVCAGPIDWIGLAQGQVPIQQVIADGVEIGVWPLGDGRWNLQELSTKERPISADFPAIDVRSGLIRLGDSTHSGHEIVCHDFQAKIGLLPRMVSGQLQPIALKIDAQVASSYFSKIAVEATLNETKTQWNAKGTIDRFELSPRLASQLPSSLQHYLTPVDGLTAELSGDFHAESNNGILGWNARGKVANGRWLNPKFPFPVDDVSGEFYCKDSFLQIRNLKAKSGDARVRLAMDWRGMTLQSPIISMFEVRDLELDQRLYNSLPAPIQETWKKMGISGRIDANAKIEFDGTQWKPEVAVTAKNVSVNADFFPYPVSGIAGDFFYREGKISAPSLVGRTSEQSLKGSLELTRAQPRWLMDLTISSDGPIPIDEQLLKALTPRGTAPGNLQRFIHSLHPTGTVHLKHGRFTRSRERPDSISRSIELTFSGCSIKYDQFKYPIVEVHGEATLDNQRLILRDFVGRNDGGRIKSFGTCQCRDSTLESLDLQFDAYDVALDEELQNALPKSVRSLWDQLQPSGVLDHVQVMIGRNGSTDPIDLRVEINKERKTTEASAKAVSFRPTSLPYSINDVACKILYRPGRIDIRSLSGLHDSSRLQAEGNCRLHGDGTWDGTIQWLPSTRFLVDQTLLSCLPKYVRDPLMRLDFRGPVSITGTTLVSSPPSPEESIVRSWNLDLQVVDGRLGGGGIASGICGTIAMQGANTSAGPMAYGIVDFDALAVKGVAVTGLNGPYALTRNDVMFGRDAIAWQNTMQLPATQRRGTTAPNNVATAVYQSDSNNSSAVPASFRQNLHERLDARFAATNRGTKLPEQQPLPPQDIVKDLPQLDLSEYDIRARTLSGTLFVSGTEPLDSKRARYRVRLVDAHLHDTLLDLGEPNADVNGRLWMQCDLQGSITNMTAIEGTGNAWLREANLYQLPVMIRLLRLLSVQPDQGAFDAANMSFSIDGDRIPIHELQLDGDLVSLRGNGWINMRRDLQLDLQANVSHRTIFGAMMRPISQNGNTNLLRIEVTGNASNPQMRRSMPLMNSLEQVVLPDANAAASR